MEQNRRRHLRKVPEKFAFIQIERDEVGKVLNASEGGLSFSSFAPISQNGPLYFWMSFNLKDRIDAMAEIAWTDSTRKIGGLRIIHQSQISREQLRRSLADMPTEQTFMEEDLRRGLPNNPPDNVETNQPDRVARFVAKARPTFLNSPLEPDREPRMQNFAPPPPQGSRLSIERPIEPSFIAPPPRQANGNGNGNGSGMHSARPSSFTATTLLGTESSTESRPSIPAAQPPQENSSRMWPRKAPRFGTPSLLGIEPAVDAPKTSRPPSTVLGLESRNEAARASNAKASARRGIVPPMEPPKTSSFAESILPLRESTLGAPKASSFTAATLRGIESAMELVSLQRHLSAKKRQLALGLFLGILLSAAVAFTMLKYKDFGTRAQNLPSLGSFLAKEKEDVAGTLSSSQSQTTPSRLATEFRPTTTPNTGKTPEITSAKEVTKTYAQPSPFDGGAPAPAPASRKAVLNSVLLQGKPQPSSTSNTRITGKKQHLTPNQLWAAVQSGSSNAAVDLAELYIKGQGVARNCQQARVLLLMASEKRNTAAIRKLQDLDHNTTACP